MASELIKLQRRKEAKNKLKEINRKGNIFI